MRPALSLLPAIGTLLSFRQGCPCPSTMGMLPTSQYKQESA